MVALANQKATQLKRDKLALTERLEEIKSREDDNETIVDLAKSWKKANYNRKKAVAMIMIHQIVVSEDGDIRIIWNI